jgi:energy-coupling factor transporter ATP-binding protein EcfA2
VNLSRIVPARGERCVIIGQTGSGKTTLAKFLCGFREYVVCLDSKGTLNWDGYELVTTLEKLQRSESPRLIYRPVYSEMQNELVVDAFFEWIYRRRHTTVYVDELAAIGDVGEYPPHFGACLTRGRELGVECWVSTQRPHAIPQVVLSESEHGYVFKLRLPQDQRRAADVVGVSPAAVGELARTCFFYAPQSGVPSGPYRLELARPAPTLATAAAGG